MKAPFNDRLDFEVIGFRQWKVDADLRLTSSAMRHEWTPGVNEAKCQKNREWGNGKPCKHSPSNGCECGLYALHVPEFWYGPDAANRGMLMFSFGDEAMYVAGLVSAWGRMEVHHNGFRAQYAQPVAIALPDGKRDAAIAHGVASEYGLPLVPQSELERIAPEFGNTVPESMRPEKPKPSDDPWLAQIITTNGSGYAAGGNPFWTAGVQATVPIFTYQTYSIEDSALDEVKPGDTIRRTGSSQQAEVRPAPVPAQATRRLRMNLLSLAELYGFYCLAAFLISTAVVAVGIHVTGKDPLRLDGRPLMSSLDEHAHERLSLEARLAEDAEVHRLDEQFALPARDHR